MHTLLIHLLALCQPLTVRERQARRRSRTRLLVLILVGTTVTVLVERGVPLPEACGAVLIVVSVAAMVHRYLRDGTDPLAQGV